MYLKSKYMEHYLDVPKDTIKIVPFVVIESLAMSVSFLISIYFVHSLGFTSFEVGKLISSMSLGVFLGSIISGYLTTKFSALTVSSWGLFLYGVSFFFLYGLTSSAALMPVMFLCGIGGVFMMIANLTALIKLAKNEAMKNRVIVLQAVIFNICLSIAGILFSYLEKNTIVYIFLIMGFCLLAASFFLRKFTLTEREKVSSYNNKKRKINLSKLILIIISVSFYGLIFSIVKVYFPATVMFKFPSPWLSSLILSLNPLFIIFVQPVLIGSIKNIKNSVLLGIGGLMLGVGYFLYGYSQLMILSMFAIVMASVGEMMFSPISKKVASQSFGEGNEGMGVAIWKMTYYLSGVYGAYIVGYLGSLYGENVVWAMSLIFSLGIFSAVVFYGFSFNFLEKKDVLI